jgi:hypothetical protein
MTQQQQCIPCSVKNFLLEVNAISRTDEIAIRRAYVKLDTAFVKENSQGGRNLVLKGNYCQPVDLFSGVHLNCMAKEDLFLDDDKEYTIEVAKVNGGQKVFWLISTRDDHECLQHIFLLDNFEEFLKVEEDSWKNPTFNINY